MNDYSVLACIVMYLKFLFALLLLIFIGSLLLSKRDDEPPTLGS